MLSIGDFARLGRISVRMLRHYDRIELLVPARVDEFSGYRYYAAEQLARLHRVIALKELGFTLDEVRRLVDDEPDLDQLREMLETRRTQVSVEHATATDRLAAVERRLRIIEKEKRMSQVEFVTKPLPRLRLAARRATVSDHDEIGPEVGPMFGQVQASLAAAGGAPMGPPTAAYTVDADGIEIIAGFAYDGERIEGLDIVDLPAAERALCAVHLGSMETIAGSWQAVHEQIEMRGLAPDGPGRESYLRADPSIDQATWVTELQQPVRSA